MFEALFFASLDPGWVKIITLLIEILIFLLIFLLLCWGVYWLINNVAPQPMRMPLSAVFLVAGLVIIIIFTVWLFTGQVIGVR